MFLLGHLGIGSRLVRPFTKGLSYRMVLLGTVLPDLIDKPLYYILSWTTGKKGADLGLISGTRTFGHTAAFLIVITLTAVVRKSKPLAALALGIASHLLLDSLADIWSGKAYSQSIQEVILWPFSNWHFPITPYHGIAEHLSIWNRPVVFWGEVVGLMFLALDYRRFRK